ISRLKAQAKSAKQSAFMRNSGYTKKGAATRHATMMTKATSWCRGVAGRAGASVVALARATSALLAEQARRLDQQHQGHDDEDHGVRGFRVEELGQPLDDAERETGHDGAHDGAHASDD